MNEKLEKALTTLIEKALNGIDAAGDFMAGEIPDVVNQILIWHCVESFIWFAVPLSFSVGIQVVLWKNREDISRILSNGAEILYIPVVGTPIFLLLGSLSSIDWLKILIAPKLYLLEYAAKIVS